MATVALLLVILGLNWMDTDEIAAMTLGMRVTAKVFFIQIRAV
jgi:hypothetical protein